MEKCLNGSHYQDFLTNACSPKPNGTIALEVPNINSNAAMHVDQEDNSVASSQLPSPIWIAPYLQGNLDEQVHMGLSVPMRQLLPSLLSPNKLSPTAFSKRQLSPNWRPTT